jgi:hypothetical protein
VKRLILIILMGFVSTISFADGLYWVVGNRATGKCDIVSANPVISDDSGGDTGYSFGDGPYKSRDDAKLARSTINVCPPPKDEKEDSTAEK